LPKFSDPNLIVGFDTSDDACVYQISEELAMVQTVDFFPPVVDDPYSFGQIAAANALSDIYAMGAKPVLAMNLLCYPTCLSKEMVQAILQGGAEKVAEAGAVLAGGHTIQDPEPKYGLCVSGFVNPKKVLTNTGAKPGDQLILTKPLGIGVMTTAAKADLLTAEEFAPAVKSMAALNKAAGEIITGYTIHSCTDVTGFGLLGHAYEMAAGSNVSIRIHSGEVPILPKALELADMGILPAGAYANSSYVEAHVLFHKDVPRVRGDLLADPQTSGGLLVAVPKEEAPELLLRLEEVTPWVRIIGEVSSRQEKAIYVE
jgi:selenide,water dikinase